MTERKEHETMGLWTKEFIDELRSNPQEYFRVMADAFDSEVKDQCICAPWIREAARYFKELKEETKLPHVPQAVGRIMSVPFEEPRIEPLLPPWVERMRKLMEAERVKILPVRPGTEVWMVCVDVHSCRNCAFLESCMRQGFTISENCGSRKPTGMVCKVRFSADMAHAWGKLVFATQREALNKCRTMKADT